VTRPDVASTRSTAFIASSDISTPFVIAAAVNEWPAPIALTWTPDLLASVTTAATSSVLEGVRTARGTQVWFLAQLRTVPLVEILLELTPADRSAGRGRTASAARRQRRIRARCGCSVPPG
jgi:hypothetical protein